MVRFGTYPEVLDADSRKSVADRRDPDDVDHGPCASDRRFDARSGRHRRRRRFLQLHVLRVGRRHPPLRRGARGRWLPPRRHPRDHGAERAQVRGRLPRHRRRGRDGHDHQPHLRSRRGGHPAARRRRNDPGDAPCVPGRRTPGHPGHVSRAGHRHRRRRR